MQFLKPVIAAVAICASASAFADVTVGYLSRATGNDYVTDALNNRQWLGFDVTKGLTYAQTLAAIGSGGQWEGYHIARNVDAAMFGTAIANGAACPSSGTPTCLSGSQDAENVVGESDVNYRIAFGSSVDFDDAWFLSDNGVGEDVGVIIVFTDDVSTNDFLEIAHESTTFAEADSYGSNTASPVGWLLYRGLAVPEPGSLALVGMALLGLVTVGRRRT
jgi:hypothetical protein